MSTNRDAQILDEGIRSLCCSVLVRALRDVVNNRGSGKKRKQRIAREAQEWIDSDNDSFMSFLSVCDILGWDPKMIRETLPKINREELQRSVLRFAR